MDMPVLSMLLVWCALPVCAMDTAARVVRWPTRFRPGLPILMNMETTPDTPMNIWKRWRSIPVNMNLWRFPVRLTASLSALLEMLQNGEVDLMGAMVYSEPGGTVRLCKPQLRCLGDLASGAL